MAKQTKKEDWRNTMSSRCSGCRWVVRSSGSVCKCGVKCPKAVRSERSSEFDLYRSGAFGRGVMGVGSIS